MFSALHQLLIDDLACIIFASLDVDGLLDDGISSTAQRLARTVLARYSTGAKVEIGITNLAWNCGRHGVLVGGGNGRLSNIRRDVDDKYGIRTQPLTGTLSMSCPV